MKQSAGILLYRQAKKGYEVLLVHPDGPFWAKKDQAAWSIPKGEFEEGEMALDAAQREFSEELGSSVPEGAPFFELGSAKQSSGKIVYAWAREAEFAADTAKSNLFEMEWPPKSGQLQSFPEVDKAAWFVLVKAKDKLVKGQVPLLEALAAHLDTSLEEAPEAQAQTALF